MADRSLEKFEGLLLSPCTISPLICPVDIIEDAVGVTVEIMVAIDDESC